MTDQADSWHMRFLKGPFPYVVVALAVTWLLASHLLPSNKPTVLPLTGTGSSFEGLIAQDQVSSAVFNESRQEVTGSLKNGDDYLVAYGADPTVEQQLINELKAKGVQVNIKPNTGFDWVGLILTGLLPVAIIVVVLIFMMNQMQGGGRGIAAFGKSRHRSVPKDQPRTTFADVAGVDEAIEELEEVKDYLANPAKFQAMGAKIPRGVLLFGPPGTGKTLLARAVAGEAGVPFYTISGSDFVEMFVGVGAARVRDLFEQAKQNAPSIVFIDEIDAVGRHRGAGLGGGHDEREQTLNQLLVEMDGFDQTSTVILMAATNRPDILDPALLRPGRFDRQVVIDRPDLEGRKAILRVHARGKPLAAEVNLDTIAKRTPGFTGADLANVINEGALLAARRGERSVTMSELEEAIDRVMAGPERKSRVMSDREKRMVAYHEAGHALVGHVLPNTDAVHKISIIPRGRALGYTQTLPEQDKFLMTRDELRDELAMLLGGRVAEQMVVGDSTTGAQNDIERATKICRQMVTEYGMSETLGPLTFGQKQGEVFLGRDFGSTQDYSDQVAFEIDQEIRKLIDDAHDRALEVLKKNESKLHLIATVLMERETIEKEELAAVLAEIEKDAMPEATGAGIAMQSRASRTEPGDDGHGPSDAPRPSAG